MTKCKRGLGSRGFVGDDGGSKEALGAVGGVIEGYYQYGLME